MADKNGKGGGPQGLPGGMPQQMDMEKARQMEEQRQQMEERRRHILKSILDAGALERLGRISLVKPEKGRQVEEILLQMAMSGRVQGPIGEQTLISLLEQVNEKSGEGSRNGPRVQIQRRRDTLDSDDDDDD
uniref:Programmed cell death protein 5 n=1 Tax=Chromera velia CCMP2878 TaxID=1169474 RepID=A0A0G4HWT8_9ALVE|mmetsp:Transcript_42135/g.83188  ORF Transcript_42135/g.83188 Transcript_42135/m.83188 type:complete len:132 (-) Transcript_42135:468-863(-)|eukprot:Cvel_9107.t1-p1 / transcript=Cvel_9107.t1 / gene=Cvel_9107 / organism=Chromera_velia_CCMP2878 / gene_product=DNA-binding protein DDB_G0278111, putative / transcript_product=DNA-binding protein DDB_G0278111, putative / location=Cvel_scaffold517:30845-33777(-) / protein_length=131 / sequence_SO=supercontig / SO=protein_coding / is_pseudo=false